MPQELKSDETVQIATYASWNEAEIAKSFLDDEGIESYVVGQEPHRGPEFAEGLRLRVLASRSERALEALRDADLLPSSPEATQDSDEGGGTYGRLIIWTVLLGLALIIVALLAYS